MPGRKNRRRVAPHRRCEANHLVNRLAFHAQRREQARDQRITRASRKNIFHCGFGLGARQIFIGYDFFKGFEDHEIKGSTHRASLRFRWLVSFREPHRSLLVLDVPSKLSSFCEHKILALFKASFRKPME